MTCNISWRGIRQFSMTILFVTAGGLGGCGVYNLDSVTTRDGANRNLDYLPWRDDSVRREDKIPNAFDLYPGMRVDITTLALRTDETNDRYFIAPASYSWTIPGPTRLDGKTRYSREDFLFLNWAMIMGVTGGANSMNRDEAFENLGLEHAQNPNTRDPLSWRLGQAIMGRWPKLNPSVEQLPGSIRIMINSKYMIGEKDAEKFSANRINRILCSGDNYDFVEKESGELNLTNARELVAEINLGNLTDDVLEIDLLLESSWFFQNRVLETVTDDEQRHNRNWLASSVGSEDSIKHMRANVEPKIAIRLHDETVSRYISPCVTALDYEHALGSEISGIRRNKYLASKLKIKEIWDKKSLEHKKKSLEKKAVSTPTDAIAPDGYVTFLFGQFPHALFEEWSFFHGASRGIQVSRDAKSEFLLGHGDIILLGDRLERVATDNPGAF